LYRETQSGQLDNIYTKLRYRECACLAYSIGLGATGHFKNKDFLGYGHMVNVKYSYPSITGILEIDFTVECSICFSADNTVNNIL